MKTERKNELTKQEQLELNEEDYEVQSGETQEQK